MEDLLIVGREVCLAGGGIGTHEEIANKRVGEGFEFASYDAVEIRGCCAREDEGAARIICCRHFNSTPVSLRLWAVLSISKNDFNRSRGLWSDEQRVKR